MDIQRKMFPNRLRVIALPMENTETVTVLVLVGTGSHYETKAQNGVSHFLEHMVFKGTKKYPDAELLNRRLDTIGAQHNAFTSKEVTGFWVKADTKHYPLAFGFVADILQNALIPAKEAERERNVIIEEMKMYFDTPRSHVWSVFERLLYGNQPAGWDIIGTKESLAGLKRPQLLKYWESQYVAENTVVIVAGNVSASRVFSDASRAFRRFRSGNPTSRASLKPSPKGPQVKVLEKKTDQTHLVLGMPGFRYGDERRHAADILATILGGYMSSRLFMNIREKRGLAYSVTASHQSYLDSGFLAVYAGIPHKASVDVPRFILEEFRKIVKNGVTAEELSRAKEHTRGHLAISLESTDEVANFVGAQELFLGKIETPDALMKKVERVTREDVRVIARSLFRPEQYHLACIGNNLPEAELYRVLR